MSQDSYNVLIVPDWREGNPYLKHLARALEKAGVNVSFSNYPYGLLKLNRVLSNTYKVKVIHLHWVPGLFESILWSKSRLYARIKCCLLILDCLFCRLRGTRVVWTIHNLVSHESRAPEIEIKARKSLFHAVTAVILHSQEAWEEVSRQYGLKYDTKKVSIIPHGNYIGDYPENNQYVTELKTQLGLSESNIVFLFFGAVRRYKGLEWMLPVFQHLKNGDYRFIVAGWIGDKALGEWVKKQSQNDPRILPCLDFIPDEEVASYFAVSDAVILPFQKTLTSGSALLAMSMGKALILPKSARVFGTPGVKGAVYFDDDQDLLEKIANLSQEQLRAMGNHNLKIASELDWGKIGKSTTDIYAGNRVIWEYPK